MEASLVLYRFEQGIPGFEHVKQFVYEEVGTEVPMKLMKAVGDMEVTLLVTSPFVFYPEYEWKLAEKVQQDLGIENEEDVEIWSVVTVPEDPMNATINLLAPIVLSRRTAQGKQLILHDHTYSSKAPLHRT